MRSTSMWYQVDFVPEEFEYFFVRSEILQHFV
jgi:hypothetical protein